MGEAEQDIAVIGIGCHFPGGEGLENFWKVLLEGRNCAVEIPEERFDVRHWYDPDESKAGRSRTAKAALIDRFNEFDHKFFGITEAEADYMDPQQKLLLECSYRALEDAGIPMEKASGTRTGVFLGLMNRDYETLLNNSPSTITHYNSTGTAMSIAANRISYTFNLTGPSFAIDCACSSSLVALHSACQAIRQGDCEMALCGGVSCIMEPRVFVALSKAKMISPDGTSKPFSSRADGYGRGEGCGIVLLKPLKEALRNCDHVWGIISKTAVNQDGRSVTPITKPSMVQQEELLRRIYSAQTDPSQVQYIEAHGTGTPVGDPTEASSISKVIAKGRPPGSARLYIGSVKGNIGHTESAAGVAGLIKVLLMMHHGTIVPSVFYSEDNASIDAKALNIKIPTKAEKWEISGPAGRVAGINSFGFGGTNAHAIVKQYLQPCISKPDLEKSLKLFVFSASSEKSVVMAFVDTFEKLKANKTVDLNRLAYTSACRRSHAKHKFRKVFMVSSLSELQAELKSSLNKKFLPLKSDPQLVFVFCGNGVTYRGMCKQLLKRESIFREKILEIENILQKYNSMSILQKLESDYDNDDSSKPDIVQLLLFAIQVAICSLLKHWGVRPDAILGHSVGEVAAAHCSGLLSLEDAVKVIYIRSNLQSQVTGGKMLVVSNMPVSEILKLLPAYSGKICLAAINSPQSCTLSGDSNAVDSLHQNLKTSLENRDLFLHSLDVPAAYHSHMMDSILSQIEENIGNLQGNEMKTEMFSTVTGEAYGEGDFTTGTYWARNVRQTVAFEQTVRSAAREKKNAVFVEIGPKRVLQRNIKEILGNDTPVFSSVQPEKDHETLLTLVSKLFELGVQVDWDQLYKGCETVPTPFPVYQFDRQNKKVYFEAVRQGNEITSQSHHPLLIQTRQDAEGLVSNLSSDAASYVWEHKHNGTVVVPGALYVELALASLIASVRPKMALCSLQLSITFQNPCVLDKNSWQMKIRLESEKGKTNFTIHSPIATYASGVIRHVSLAGHKCTKDSIDEKHIILESVFRRCKSVITTEKIYELLSQAGFQYGSVFQCLESIHYGEDLVEAVSVIKASGETLRHLHEYCVHPVLLDCFLQMTAVIALSEFTSRPAFPSEIGSMIISKPMLEEMVVYFRRTRKTADYFEICGCFADKEGNVLVELRSVRITFVGDASGGVKECFYHNEIHVISEDEILPNKPKALVFEDQMGLVQALKDHLDPQSTFISYTDSGKWLSSQLRTISHLGVSWDFDNVLFMHGMQDLSPLTAEEVLECLADCCEFYRQVVLMTKKDKCCCTVRVITYRSAENSVDHISPGFVLSGMTRSCAVEISDISLQLIDLASVSSEDIGALADVIYSYPSSKYPEVMIKKGQIHSTTITRTLFKNTESFEKKISTSESFTLQTADPYTVTTLSAIPSHSMDNSVIEQTVEVQLDKVCVHSSDFFPVSYSDLNFGQTIYWNKHTSQNHKLMALDFSGRVTAVGKDVSKLKVGDHVVSCYPVVASSKVVIPEAVCYRTKKLPFLKKVPCMSYFVLAWEILHIAMPGVKPGRKLGIGSSDPYSSLLQILVHTATKSGWITVVGTDHYGAIDNVNECDVLILLPPFNPSLVAKMCSISTMKHIIFVCDRKGSSPLSDNTMRINNENVYIQNIQVANIFQKAYLKRQKTKIDQWLKSMLLYEESLNLPAITFQKSVSRDCDSSVLESPESYFRSKAISVVVLDNGTNGMKSDIPILVSSKQLFKKDSVYVVTGGLSGLGLETVKFIAHRGGRCIVTLSRRGLSTEVQLEINVLQSQYDVSITCLQCDVSDLDQVMKAISVTGQRFPTCPIRGVFHSAVVLQDGLIETLDKSAFMRVLKPKVTGALNLHYATINFQLDYFVCYSSISSVIGNASQANYAAANSFLDLFCHYRRNHGLAGQSINWGALNLGLLLNRQHFQRFLESKGMEVMGVPEFHESLEHCLLLGKAQQVVCKFNFKNLKSHVFSQNISLQARLSTLIELELKTRRVTKTRLQQPTFPFSAETYVKSVLSETCNMDLQEMSDDTALSALGIDSMLAMTLQNVFFQGQAVTIPLVKLLDPNSTLLTLITIINSERGNKLDDEQDFGLTMKGNINSDGNM
ncbi:mycolipanoate synthase-like [Paramormyrops kingsleyae]|uniref:mycolipanoate synthase-like n=1 Tax=Paramormyrops kingsleyae TaxID=1676925 RepID=UPI003B97B363